MDFLEKQKKIEETISKYQDVLGYDAQNIALQKGIGTFEANKDALKKLENQNRLLQLGIVGRVKSGKSSLLNALLFDGKPILPKAATPMTAALTIISYGEELSATVEFFTKEDIENIKKRYEKYQEKKQELLEKYKEELGNKKLKKLSKISKQSQLSEIDLKEIEEKANRKANRELKANIVLAASYEQYEKIKQSNVDINYITSNEHKVISADTLSELSEKLIDYVSATGKYMPFTKSVHIKIPDKKLKDIQIVDTPGVNDPVVSREERTRELLKHCDAILIVSPSGQFINQDDINLMDRITTKEGVRELFVVASQVDNQLFGSIKRDSNGDLHKALELVTKQLAEHLHSSLMNLKSENPEIGSTYDQLIDESKNRVIHSSGISQTIITLWGSYNKWDSGVITVWNNLKNNYPDYFSDQNKELSIENLKKLANIKTINQIIQKVKDKKEDILIKRKENFISTKDKVLKQYQDALLKRIEEKISEITNTELKKLKEEESKLDELRNNISAELEFEYKNLLSELEQTLLYDMKKQLDSHFQEIENKIYNSLSTETRSYKIEKDGFLSWLARLFGGGYETRTETYTTVLAGTVRNNIENLTIRIENTIKEQAKKTIADWRVKAPKRLIRCLRNLVDDGDLDAWRVKQVILNIFNSIYYPDISYPKTLPSILKKNGKLTGKTVDRFLAATYDYVSNLKCKIANDIDNYINDLIEKLDSFEISSSFTEEYQKSLDDLKQLIENKLYSIDMLNRLKKDLQTIDKIYH